MGPTGRRPDSDHTPRLAISPACCPWAIFAGAILHRYTEKYIVYICIDAAGPVARENQRTTMSRRLIVRVVSASGQALEGYKETVFLCEPFDTLLDIFGKAGLEDRVPISCLVLPHAAAPDSEGTAWDDLNATLGAVDKGTLDLGLQRISVLTFTVRAGIQVHTSTAADQYSTGVRGCYPSRWLPQGRGAMHTLVRPCMCSCTSACMYPQTQSPVMSKQ